MIKSYSCTNISSKDVKSMVEFYHDYLGIPIIFDGYGDYDGVRLGFLKDAPAICIWDENKWTPYEGIANFVFKCDSLDITYHELIEKGLSINPPYIADWGGSEMVLADPEGNKVLIIE